MKQIIMKKEEKGNKKDTVWVCADDINLYGPCKR